MLHSTYGLHNTYYSLLKTWEKPVSLCNNRHTRILRMHLYRLALFPPCSLGYSWCLEAPEEEVKLDWQHTAFQISYQWLLPLSVPLGERLLKVMSYVQFKSSVSTDLDPEISQTLSQHPDSLQQLIWGPCHIYNKGLLGLASMRGDMPNLQDTWDPREWRGLAGWNSVEWGYLLGDGGEEEWDREQSGGRPGMRWRLDCKSIKK